MSDTGSQYEGVEIVSAQKTALDSLEIPPGENITIHMVHLNHLDLTWFWRLPDTIEMCLETIRWHVDLLENHPDARYSHTQVFILKVVEQIDYPLFLRFAKLVAEGRVEIDSGQWVEPDHNLPSGESLARQFLYGQQFIESRFGIRARTLVNSDSFGHARSLPQLMRQAGIEHMIFKRPRQRFVDLPETPFLWKGIDGTEIHALRFINKGAGLPSLSQWHTLPPGTNELQEKIDRNLAIGIHHFFGSHCISDAGGVAPYVQPCRGKGYELRYSTPTEFFHPVLAEGRDLPIINRPLNYVYQGCYTTHIEEKEHCRRAERELREIELLWTLAAIQGRGYPGEAIAELWRRCCFLQFHDILPGTGSHEAHSDNAAHYHELFLRTGLLRRKAQLILDSISSNRPSETRSSACDMDKSDEKEGNGTAGRNFCVVNPRASRSGGIAIADVEMPLSRDNTRPGVVPASGLLVDGEGNQVPYQIVETRSYGRYVRGSMIFPCPPIPAFGLKRLKMLSDSANSAVYARNGTLENEKLRVEVGGPGIIRSIVTREDGREWLRTPINIELWPETEYPGDYGSPMKAWMLGITERRHPAEHTGMVEVTENGPARATIRTEHRWGSSCFRTDVSLYAGQDWIELRCELDWNEKEVLCRLCIEPKLGGELRRCFGIPFGMEIASGDELEVPVVGWADISGDDGGFALLNIDRPGHTFRGGALRVSLVRCATGDWDPCTDSGIIRTTLRLLPHTGTIEDARIPERSDEFSYPPIAWQSEADVDAKAGGICEPVRIEGDGIVVASLKVAERGGGIVLRVFESLGRETRAWLRLGTPLLGWRIVESNILEDELEPIECHNDTAVLRLRPFEIKTILIISNERFPGPDEAFSGDLFSDRRCP